MITTLRAAEIVIQYRLVVRHVDSVTAPGWVALSSSESRLHRGLLPTYEAAVEAAELAIQADESRALETDKRTIHDALESGDYWIRPRMTTIPGDTGPASVRVFDLMQQDARGVDTVVAAAESSYSAAGAQAVRATRSQPQPQPQPQQPQRR